MQCYGDFAPSLVSDCNSYLNGDEVCIIASSKAKNKVIVANKMQLAMMHYRHLVHYDDFAPSLATSYDSCFIPVRVGVIASVHQRTARRQLNCMSTLGNGKLQDRHKP